MYTTYWDRIPITETKDDWVYGTSLYFSQNQLSVDDDMLLYNTRSVTFMNYEPQLLSNFRAPQWATHFANEEGEEIEDVDTLHYFGLNLS